MRGLTSTIVAGLALTCAGFIWGGCSGNGADGADGGGGTGGSGGSGTDATGDTGQVGCVSQAPTACPTPAVTYGTVQPIFQARCVSVCHNNLTIDPATDAAIWGFTDYEHVVSWQDTIRPQVLGCTMPPADAGVPVTVEERRAILEWIRCGVPK